MLYLLFIILFILITDIITKKYILIIFTILFQRTNILTKNYF